MSELDAYLFRYFANAEQFASICRLSVRELDALVQQELVPAASYVVTNSNQITSFAFGPMSAVGATNGAYFRSEHVIWVDRARRALAQEGPDGARALVRRSFTTNLQAALAQLNASTWRLRDSFHDDGSVITPGLTARLDSYWQHFLKGTFGLCVSHPASESGIALKEVLQEKLTSLTANGSLVSFPGADTTALLELIAAYADAAMPFSPVEYPVSSKKRLVDDLRERVRLTTPMAK